MTKSDIPIPTCLTCRESANNDFMKGSTTYFCKNCGTEMRYMPAGELLHFGGSKTKAKDYNGWVISFSVRSSELYSSYAMIGVGGLILLLTLCFLWLGRIGTDAAFWTLGSGIVLIVIGKVRSTRQKNKTRATLNQYPHWQK